MEYADTNTGLIPQNLTSGINTWNAHNSAADNYPFMVLTAWITDSLLFKGIMHDILETEIKLTSRLGNLPDNYLFSEKGFEHDKLDIERLIFGASEYVKDGLLPMTELLGESPWSERMIGLIDDIWANACVQTQYGLIPSTNVEVNGEQLQILSRVYWMTDDDKYLNWAIRLGDYYLLNDHHPTRNFEVLRLRDHGCEIISGLCELYACVNYALPEKKKQYEKPVHEMLDRILEIGTNQDGIFYNSVNPIRGEIIDERLADTWGYTYNGFYTVYLIDKTEKYRDSILYALNKLNHYRNFNWESGSADGFADAIESALNLYNREPLPVTKEWIDSETKIIYCLWKTKGITVTPWRDDIIIGAISENDKLYISIKSGKKWNGKLIFDTPRHKYNMRLPIDWPRINQFPEWFTINPQKKYRVKNLSQKSAKNYKASELTNGLHIKLDPDITYRLNVTEL